jgi:DNA-binding transcriptional ArsR family regulator
MASETGTAAYGVPLEDVEMARVGSLIGDATRASLLLALSDGRALTASQLAREAGVSPAAVSQHLGKLVGARLLGVERYGRYRYYRLGDQRVAATLEQLAQVAPPKPIRSLRQSTRAQQLRLARTCYDHLAGRLGVGLMAALIERGALQGHDGTFAPAAVRRDRPSAPGHDVEYRLTGRGHALLEELEIPLPEGRRPLVAYCVDWTEQRHHLRGRLGRAVLDRLLALDWIRRQPQTRAVSPTEAGRVGLRDWLGLEVSELASARRP